MCHPAGQSCLRVHVKEIERDFFFSFFFLIYCSLTGMQNAAVGSGAAWPCGWRWEEAVRRSPFRGTAGRASPARQPATALPALHFPRPRWLVLRCCHLYRGVKVNLE